MRKLKLAVDFLPKSHELVIVGGGIDGAALLYVVSRYTDIKDVLLLEKYSDIATLNSNSRTNAQTLHVGDIETNYTVEKAREVKRAADYVLSYTRKELKASERARIIQACQKMVLGVGSDEIESLERIYASGIRSVFPSMRKLGRSEIARLEPNVVRGRNPRERIMALSSGNGYMVDFGRLARTFVDKARKVHGKRIEVRFNDPVLDAKRGNEFYTLETKHGRLYSDFVAFEAGTYSLYFAKKFGYDRNISILAVGGGYYFSKRVLNGKVYRVQKGGIPFAAVHADPDITNDKVTRYGPTATIELELEKDHPETAIDYIETFDLDMPTAETLENILLNRDISRIIRTNMLYSIPVIGKRRFLENEARKIVPRLRYEDLWMGRHVGGIRPQIIDENRRKLVLGEAKLQREGLVFNITPSPGATSCIASALEDTLAIVKYLGKEFYADRFEEDLGQVQIRRKVAR
jgi:malate dehydrogenase (quinone)